MKMESKMKKQIKCWAEELYEEFNFYDYKGAFVIAKTEKEKKEIANKHKSLSDQRLKEAKKRGLIVVPEDFFLITSDTEESVDAEIKRNEEVKKTISSSYVSTSRKPKRKQIHEQIKKSISDFVLIHRMKKIAFIKGVIEANPNISHWIVRGQIKKLFKQRFIEIDKTFKTKPFVVKGKYWREI